MDSRCPELRSVQHGPETSSRRETKERFNEDQASSKEDHARPREQVGPGETESRRRQDRCEIQHSPVELERGLVHELPADLRQQCRPGAGLDPGGVREARREVRLLPLHARERLLPALHPQPRQHHPLRRVVSSHPRSCGNPPDPAAGGDPRTARRRLHDGARPGRYLPDGRTEGQEDRPVEEPQHHQERLVAHPGASGNRTDAADQRHDDGRRGDRRVPLPGRLVQRSQDAGADGEPVRPVAASRPQA